MVKGTIMSWEAVGAVGEILGAVAVLATLIYLARQIKQSNRVSKFETSRDVMAGFDQTTRILAVDKELVEAILKTPGQQSEPEDYQVNMITVLLCNNWANVQVAYDQGLIEPAMFEAVKQSIPVTLEDSPSFYPHLERWLQRYPTLAACCFEGRTLWP